MAMKGSTRKVELQRNELEDMLGRVPGWITRNGMILFIFLFALLRLCGKLILPHFSLTLMMGSFTITLHSNLKAQKLYHIE